MEVWWRIAFHFNKICVSVLKERTLVFECKFIQVTITEPGVFPDIEVIGHEIDIIVGLCRIVLTKVLVVPMTELIEAKIDSCMIRFP